MTLAELISKYKWADIETTLIKNYPDQIDSINSFKKAYESLQLIDIEKVRSKIQIMLVSLGFENETKEDWVVDVNCLRPDMDENGMPQVHSLMFVPWKEWLGMTIVESAFSEFNDQEILAHCLWEMTFNGFDEETIRREAAALRDSVDKLNSMTNEEKKANSTSWEEMKIEFKQMIDECE